MNKFSKFSKNFLKRNFLAKNQIRFRTDRSFRLANVSDLEVGQRFSSQAVPEHFTSFKQTSELRQRDISRQVVIDLSHEQGYCRGHIRGAINLPAEVLDFSQLVDVQGGLTQEEVYSAIKQLGVNNDTSEIILYDNSGSLACRAWFVLRYFGFRNVRILNGGWRAWLRAGMPVDEGIPEPSVDDLRKPLDLKDKRTGILTKPTGMIFTHQSNLGVYIDSRSPESFRIRHIPRAINIPAREFMADGEFQSVSAIRGVIESHGISHESEQPIIIYSSDADSACVAYFCISMAGYDRVSVYDAGIRNWVQNFDSNLSIDAEEHMRL